MKPVLRSTGLLILLMALSGCACFFGAKEYQRFGFGPSEPARMQTAGGESLNEAKCALCAIAGADLDSDAYTFGATLLVDDLPAGLQGMLTAEIGRGSNDYDYDPSEYQAGTGAMSKAAVAGFEEKYRILRIGVHAAYPVTLVEESGLSVAPLAGTSFYRRADSDCEGMCLLDDVNALGLDAGAAAEYGPFGLKVFTRLVGKGPDLSVRLRYRLPIGVNRSR